MKKTTNSEIRHCKVGGNNITMDNDSVANDYNKELLSLCIEIAIWEDDYREKHCKDKTEKKLRELGWKQTFDGEWHCEKMERARKRKFNKKLEKLGELILLTAYPTTLKLLVASR